MEQVDLGRRVRTVREAEEGHGDGERGEGRAEHEIEIRAGGRGGRHRRQIAHDRATRGFNAA